MSISVTPARRTSRPSRTKKVSPFSAVGLSNIDAAIDPVDSVDLSIDREPPVSTTRLALDEFDEQYKTLLESVDVEKFDPAKIKRYIKRAETRRGAPFIESEKQQYHAMAQSTDANVLRLLAVELQIGVSRNFKKIKLDAEAAMARVILNRHDQDALKAFLDDPHRDPNMRDWVRTTLYLNRVEYWIKTVDDYKRRFTSLGKLGRSAAKPVAAAVIGPKQPITAE